MYLFDFIICLSEQHFPIHHLFTQPLMLEKSSRNLRCLLLLMEKVCILLFYISFLYAIPNLFWIFLLYYNRYRYYDTVYDNRTIISTVGFFANLSVSDRSNPNGNAAYAIVLTWAEMELLKNLIQFSIPRMLGFDKVF